MSNVKYIYRIWEGEYGPEHAFRGDITPEEWDRVAFSKELIVELVLSKGWKLASVTSVGGCRKNHDRYHFIKEVEK